MDEKTIKVYVELLEEGTPTIRGTQAIDLGDGMAKLLPTHNYDPEDEIITAALNQMNVSEINEENIAAIIFNVWRQSFNLDNADLTARESAINEIAKRITIISS